METSSSSTVELGVAPVESEACLIVPFPLPLVPVHVLDENGCVYPAKMRSEQEDFKQAIRSLDLLSADIKLKDESDTDLKKNAEDDNDSASKDTTHLLEPCLKALGMAQAELNQLSNLIDMVKVSEYVRLVRGSKMVPCRTAAITDKSESAAALKYVRKTQLSKASEKLAKRAHFMRISSKRQKTFQDGILSLRKNWRIVTLRSGLSKEVSRPLALGEQLAIDCSSDTIDNMLPNDQVVKSDINVNARTQEESNWLVPITCDDNGNILVSPNYKKDRILHTIVVEIWADSKVVVASSSLAEGKKIDEISNLDDLELYLKAVQHSSVCEKIFEMCRNEALNTEIPWILLGCDVSDQPEGSKRKNVTDFCTKLSVVSVLDDTVEVEIDGTFTMKIARKLITSERFFSGIDETKKKFKIACKLALLELSHLMHVQITSEAKAVKRNVISTKSAARNVSNIPGKKLSMLHSVLNLLRHHLLRNQVCTILQKLSQNFQYLGVQFEVIWGNLNLQQNYSRAILKLGKSFSCLVIIKGTSIILNCVPSTHGFGSNHQRCITVQNCDELGHLINSEVCRQIVPELSKICKDVLAVHKKRQYSIQTNVHSGEIQIFGKDRPVSKVTDRSRVRLHEDILQVEEDICNLLFRITVKYDCNSDCGDLIDLRCYRCSRTQERIKEWIEVKWSDSEGESTVKKVENTMKSMLDSL